MRAPLRPPAAPGPRASRRTIVFAGIGLVLAAFAVYANSFSGPFIFDDLLSIPQNPTIRRLLTSLVPLGGGLTVTGRPLLNLSFALNYALSGDHVWSYHALNLLIHLLAGLTLFGIARRTLAGPGASSRKPVAPSSVLPQSDATFVALAVAVLWTLHPLQTESVTYIVQRAESLMGLFFLLTLYWFIRATECDADRGSVETAEAPRNQGQRTNDQNLLVPSRLGCSKRRSHLPGRQFPRGLAPARAGPPRAGGHLAPAGGLGAARCESRGNGGLRRRRELLVLRRDTIPGVGALSLAVGLAASPDH
jgi:hypothetical protein